MKKLLEIAASSAAQAEVFSVRTDSVSLRMRNGIPTDISATIQSGFALRIIRDGMIGTAYTKNLLDREQLVRNALAGLKGEVKADFSFPGPADLPSRPTPDGSIEEMGCRELRRHGGEVLESLKGRVEGQIDVHVGRGVSRVAIVNTSGLEVSDSSAQMYVFASLLFPNTETSIHRVRFSNRVEGFPPGELDAMVSLYDAGLPEIRVESGRMKALFTQDTLYTLLWRLSAGASGKSIHERVSPLIGREGERVISEKVSFGGDPTDPDDIDQRFFDDEGVPASRRMFFENGVFTGPALNLDYAARLGRRPTGNGYRKGDETVASLPSPAIQSPFIAPGDARWDEMVASMDRGVVVLGVLGAHSGNILNGDYSVGLNPGYYVEDGRIVGRVKDGMIAGNAYETLGNVASVEAQLNQSVMGGRYPSILLDDVSVTARN
ncbi:MAG: TldD/PmbA family protein [Candidatus Eisenbacteria bacterium]|nr:TldD/PmbA family protein [Candidatus Eisenbacteria bacterium]